jgi:hypothetical protein
MRPKEMKHPSWLPDWRESRYYPAPGSTSSRHWAWEFLRRNPEYQQLWEKPIKPEYDAAEMDVRLQSTKPTAPGHRFRPRLTCSPLVQFEKQFHLSSYPPPPSMSRPNPLFTGQFVRYITLSKPGEVRGWLDENEIVMWFNPSWPLRPQLAKAEKLLKDHSARIANRNFKIWPKNYGKYLRLIDARAVEVSYSQIASRLYSHLSNTSGTNQAKNDFKVAKRLRDHNFWRIAVQGN